MRGIEVTAPRFEHHHNGLSVDTSTPRLSWSFTQHDDNCNGWHQISYEVEVLFDGNQIVEKSEVKSSQCICVPWPARPLKSREAAKVRVRCQGRAGKDVDSNTTDQPTEWSPWSVVEIALLDSAAWTAQWIAPPEQEKNENGSLKPIRVAKSFQVPFEGRNTVKRARLYVTARGCYDAYINGQVVGKDAMAPGWQSYTHRLHYQVYDVTDILSTDGKNTIDVCVGPGWYASALAWAGGRRCFFGNELSLLAQLMVDFEDGIGTFVLASDNSWKVLECPIISSEIYNGEIFDMSAKVDAWVALQDESHLQSVRVVKPPLAKLISPEAPPVTVVRHVRPTNILRSKSGKFLVDFGQNLVGRLCVKNLQKPSGTVVSFSHAEVLEADELGRRPLRNAASTDKVICDGSNLSEWTPKFTFHGFRYVEITGWTCEDRECPLGLDNITAQVMHTDMRPIGSFECSHDMVNKLHENATWSMRGNFLSVPTDCPQRDERLGWTGDIQVFAPSANFLFDTTGMLGNWLEDLAAEQLSPEHNGVPPFVVPDVISKAHDKDDAFWPKIPNAVWDDVAVLLPTTLYQASGDTNVLQKQYQSMKAWLDRGVRRGTDRLWDPELYQLGDWLDPIAPPAEPGNGRTDGTLVADAYLVQVTRKMADSCTTLGKSEDAARYDVDHASLLATFRRKYITAAGLIASDTQTALALGIVFELLQTDAELKTAGDRLARSVRMQQFRVATGFAGTPIILHALTATGHSDLAYRMLLEQQCPSWMYAVLMGATTIWERWDSMLPDGSINPGEMTSFNHYALGSVVNWMHEVVGGISALEPGWRKVLVRPIPGGGLTWAKVKHESPYGTIECSWRIESDAFKMTVQLPPNTMGKVILPVIQSTSLLDDQGYGAREVGSGIHNFECTFGPQPKPPQAIMPPFWPQPQPVWS